MTDRTHDTHDHVTDELPVPDFAIAVYSDVGCPWAHVAVHRLARSRRDRGLDAELRVDHRAFPLELLGDGGPPKRAFDAAVPVCARLEPGAGWSNQAPPATFPVSTLPALDAVQAAKRQGPAASERLDLALRRALFGEWRDLSDPAAVLSVAATVAGIDTARLAADIASGAVRADVMAQRDQARADAVVGSPTFVLPGGAVVFNPGIELRWEAGRPIIDRDDPTVIDALVDAALAARPAD